MGGNYGAQAQVRTLGQTFCVWVQVWERGWALGIFMPKHPFGQVFWCPGMHGFGYTGPGKHFGICVHFWACVGHFGAQACFRARERAF